MVIPRNAALLSLATFCVSRNPARRELLEVSEKKTQNIFCCEMALNGHKNTNLYIFNATSSAAPEAELSSSHISFHPQQINDKLPGRSTKSVT
jgi:hypothetical protein